MQTRPPDARPGRNPKAKGSQPKCRPRSRSVGPAIGARIVTVGSRIFVAWKRRPRPAFSVESRGRGMTFPAYADITVAARAAGDDPAVVRSDVELQVEECGLERDLRAATVEGACIAYVLQVLPTGSE